MKAILEEPLLVCCIAAAIMTCALVWDSSKKLSGLELQAYQACLQAVGPDVQKCDHVIAALKGVSKP